MQKILMLTENIAIVYSGMGPDFRVLVRKGRKSAQQYYRVYRETIPVSMLVRELAAVMQEFTQRGGVRPFGISTLIMGFDVDGVPRLYQTEPSGNHTAWKAVATGRNQKTVKEFLEKNYNEETAADGVKLACRALLEVVEAGGKNIEVAVLKKGEELRMLPDEEVEALCTELEAEKAAAEAAKKPAQPQ